MTIYAYIQASRTNLPLQQEMHNPRADGAKRRERVLIPPGYLHPWKRKH